ncbi:DUF3857 domain-containing protein [Luteimonas sp. SDU82]|uniref:DUF3857 domain-containing protein n=1 Tax=Luteimonas sp. SDU82 TaxID=3422592 RepID=UPI003EB93E80
MRVIAMALALLAGIAQVCASEHVRGEYRFSTGGVPEFVERGTLPAQWPADAPGAEEDQWRYWLYDVQADRRRSGDVLFVDYAYEARGASMVGDAGRFQISFNPGYQQLMLHSVELRRAGVWQDRLVAERISLARREDGFENDMSDGTVTALIVLDDVRAGDVVRLAYTITGSNPVLAGQGSDWLRFGWKHPTLRSRLRVLMDPGVEPQWYIENGAPEPFVRRHPDSVEVVLDAERVPAIVDEGQYPAWFQPFPLAQVSRQRSWQDVVAWGLPLYPVVERLPQDLERQIAEWRRLPDRRARITAALRLVQDEVRYFGVEMGENTHRPTPPEETWRRRYGDCKDKVYLLVSLLSRMDIRATPALVSTRRGKAAAAFVPSAAVFDHVIARVEDGGRVLWLDPTMIQQGGQAGDYDHSDYGVALALASGTAAMEPIAAPQGRIDRNGVAAVERYLPQAEGTGMLLEVETTYRGDNADHRRRALASERGEDLSRRYADYYRNRLGELEVAAPPRFEDDRDANRLRVTEHYLLKAPFDDEPASVKALDLYADTLHEVTRLPSSIARVSPLDYARPGRYRHQVEVGVPERWTPAFGKEGERISAPAFDYSRQLGLDGGTVRLVHELEIGRPTVEGGDASLHLARIRELQDGMSSTLRFRAPATLDAAERKQRLQQLLRNAMNGGSGQ